MAIALITKGKICFAGTSAQAIDNRIVNLKITLKKGLAQKMTTKLLTDLVKGDTIILEHTIDTDITNWKLRAEFCDDCGNEIKLATNNVTGGSANQIEVTEITATESVFLVKVPSGATDCFDDKSKYELEAETTNIVAGEPEKQTLFQANIDFKKQKITWEDVT